MDLSDYKSIKFKGAVVVVHGYGGTKEGTLGLAWRIAEKGFVPVVWIFVVMVSTHLILTITAYQMLTPLFHISKTMER